MLDKVDVDGGSGEQGAREDRREFRDVPHRQGLGDLQHYLAACVLLLAHFVGASGFRERQHCINYGFDVSRINDFCNFGEQR